MEILRNTSNEMLLERFHINERTVIMSTLKLILSTILRKSITMEISN